MQRTICISAAVFLVCVDGITGGGHVENCPRITLADGNVTYRHMWLLGGYEKASFTCNQGFQLQGYERAYCIHPPVWSGRRPSCTPITCRKLTAPSDGRVSQPGGSRVMYGETANFTCNSGFVLRGSSVRTCGGSGVWSGMQPSCVRERMLSTEGCHHFQVANGDVTYQGLYGKYIKASVSCNRGYKIRGHHTYCIHPPVWSGRKPSCREITCSRLKAPSNGKVSQPAGSRIVYGQKGTFSCNSGFTLLGSPERTCGRSGVWSGIQPSCRRSCPRFGVANGKVTWVPLNGYEMASVSCNKGYRLHGGARAYCIHPPVWSGRSPSCVREIFNHTKNCPRFDVVHGKVTWVQRRDYEMATVSCNRGYQLRGSQHIYCIFPPVLFGRRPSCIPNSCVRLTAPSNGTVSQPGSGRVMVGQVAKYSCNSGFVIRRSSVRTCGRSGVWSGKQPTCSPVRCPDLEAPAHGGISGPDRPVYGDEVVFMCQDGYELRGQEIVVCESTGQWSGQSPQCIAMVNRTAVVLCEPLNEPHGGAIVQEDVPVYQSTAVYNCKEGFYMRGIPVRTCELSGTWSGQAPTCAQIECEALSEPDNGKVSQGDSNTIGQQAVYTCNQGHELQGDVNRTCTLNGTHGYWSGSEPFCVQQYNPEVWREGQVQYLIDDCDIVDDEAKINLTEALKEKFYQEGVCPQINKLSCKIEDVSVTCGESDRPWIPSNIVTFEFNITRDQLPLSRVNCGVYCNSVRQPDESCLSTCYNSSRSEVNRNINSAVETLQELFTKHGGNYESPGVDGSRPQTNGRTKLDLLLGTTVLRPATSRVRTTRMNMLCGGGTVPTQNGFCSACEPGTSTPPGAASCWP